MVEVNSVFVIPPKSYKWLPSLVLLHELNLDT